MGIGRSNNNGGGGPGSIDVQDEGIVVVPAAAIMNFIGVGVTAQQNGVDPTKVDVYIPPPSFVSHFNTSDGTTNGVPAGITLTNRHVSDPVPPGNFSIGAWAPNSVQPCLRISSYSYSPPGDISFLANSVFEVIVYGSDGVTPAATHLTAAINGNIDVTVSNIRIQVTGWAADVPKFRGDVTVTVNIDAIFPFGGRFSVKITHFDGVDGNFIYTQGPMFSDVESFVQALSGVAIAENTLSSSKWLSGLRYYDEGDTFDLSIADLDYLNSESYPDGFVAMTSWTTFGITNTSVNPGDAGLTGWTALWNNTNTSYLVTKAITRDDWRYITGAGIVSGQVTDWAVGASANSPGIPVCIDTWDQQSTPLAEYFTDEVYRRVAGMTGAEGLWNSTQDLTTYDDTVGAMVHNGLLQVGFGDWTTYNPNPAGQPDYSGMAAPATYYRRFTDVTSGVRNSCTMTIAGFQLADLIAERIRMWIMIPGRFISPCYAHSALTYDFGTFTGNNDPIRVASSTAFSIDLSFGTLGLNPANNYFIMYLQIVDGSIKPDSIVVNW